MTDYNFLMESTLSSPQFQLVNALGRIANNEGINLYLVGGAVRDMTFGQAVVRDLDFAAEGNIDKILRHLIQTKPKGKKYRKSKSTWALSQPEVVSSRIEKKHASAELVFSNGVRAGIAQCHQEVVTRPGRPPDIKPAMIFEDLKSRDFALNAMAISLHPNSRGLLLDPKNGAGDIERHEIRALQPRSFWDDPVRIYRLFRLGLRFEFTPDEKTQRWLDSALEERLWCDLPPDKQAGEIKAVLQEENPGRVLKLYQDRGLLVGLDRSLTRIAYDRFRKVNALARKFPGEDMFLLNFDCLVSKLSTPHKARLTKKVLADPENLKIARNLERDAKNVARLLSRSKCATPSQAYKVLSQQSRPLLFFLLAYYPQAKVQSRIKNFLVKAPQVRARLPESELLVLGVKPGPKFDEILERVFMDQLDGKIKTHHHLLQELRSLAGIKEPQALPARPAKSERVSKPAKGPKAGKASKVGKPAKGGRAATSSKHAKAVKSPKVAKSKRLTKAGRLARIAQAVNKRKKKRSRG